MMKVLIYFKHLEHTPDLEKKIKEKSHKFEALIPKSSEIKWTCWVANDQYFSEVSIHGPRLELHAQTKTNSFYKSLDQVSAKIEKQILKRKEMCKKHNQKQNNVIFLKPETTSRKTFDPSTQDEESPDWTEKKYS